MYCGGSIIRSNRSRFSYRLLFSCSPTSDGAGAAVLASENFVRRNGLEKKAVEIIAQEMVTDLSSTFEENSCMKMVRVAGILLSSTQPKKTMTFLHLIIIYVLLCTPKMNILTFIHPHVSFFCVKNLFWVIFISKQIWFPWTSIK